MVLTGAASRQLLVFISTIAIASYFDVASIAKLTLFISITSVAQHFVFLKIDYRYVSLIGQRKKYEQLSLAVISLIIQSILLSVVLAYYIDLDGFELLLPILCVSIFTGGLAEKVLLRDGNYSEIRKLKFTDGLSQLVLPFALVKIFPSDFSLLASRAFCFLAYISSKINKKVVLFQIKFIKNLVNDQKGIFTRLISVLKSNLFIIYSGLLSSVSLNIPVFFLASEYEADVLGNYGIVMRFLSVPVTLVGLSLSSVLFSEISKAVRSGELNKVKSDFIKFSGYTLILSLIVFVVCVFYPNVLSLVLDDKWGMAPQIVTALSFHLAGQMFVSPLSTLSISLEKNKQQAILDSFRLAVLLFVIFYFDNGDVIESLTLFSVSSFFIYLLYYAFYYYLVRRRVSEVIH